MNTIFEGKPLDFFGKGDDKFVNDKIRELRKKRNDLQDKIYELSRQLDKLEKECNNTQKEIDVEFLKQEHACDLVGNYIKCNNIIALVTNVERLFDGVKLLSNWWCVPEDESFYAVHSPEMTVRIISFDELETILSGKDENFKFIPKTEALEIFNQIIEENNKKIYEK